MTLQVLDLFCGAGGFSLGFKQKDFDIIAGIDFDADAIETYRHNLGVPGYCLNLQENPSESILELLDLSPDDVDAVIGGPPCQDFSDLSLEPEDESRRLLLQNYMNYVDDLEPRAFVMENVKGLVTRHHEYLDAVIERGERLGYEMDYRVLTASHYGVPQQRERVFVVGIHESEKADYEWPEPTTEDNPPVAASVLVYGTGPDEGWPNSEISDHNDDTKTSWRKGGYKSDPYSSSAHQIRLHPEEPSWTVVAQHGHFHPYKARRLTVREEATLQSFPRYYHFYGSKDSATHQVGNAVPPRLAEHIAGALLLSLDEPEEHPTESVGGSMKEIADYSGRLTEREVESVLLRSGGLTWKEVGREMDISHKSASNLYYRAESKVEEAQETIDAFERLTE